MDFLLLQFQFQSSVHDMAVKSAPRSAGQIHMVQVYAVGDSVILEQYPAMHTVETHHCC